MSLTSAAAVSIFGKGTLVVKSGYGIAKGTHPVTLSLDENGAIWAQIGFVVNARSGYEMTGDKTRTWGFPVTTTTPFPRVQLEFTVDRKPLVASLAANKTLKVTASYAPNGQTAKVVGTFDVTYVPEK